MTLSRVLCNLSFSCAASLSISKKNLKLERTELFEESELEELEKLLNSLKEKLDIGSKVTEGELSKAVSDCIEEIRYLFKSVDYKYENELRILRYANLDPSNKEIKIDKNLWSR